MPSTSKRMSSGERAHTHTMDRSTLRILLTQWVAGVVCRIHEMCGGSACNSSEVVVDAFDELRYYGMVNAFMLCILFVVLVASKGLFASIALLTVKDPISRMHKVC